MEGNIIVYVLLVWKCFIYIYCIYIYIYIYIYTDNHHLTMALFFFLNACFFFTVWRRAEMAFGLVLYHVSCQCRVLAWPFIVINRKVCSAELE